MSTSEVMQGKNITRQGRIKEHAASEPRVIILTLDGIRPVEFFDGIPEEKAKKFNIKRKKLFRTFWQRYAKQGAILGFSHNYSSFKIATSTPLSLPSYHSMFLGKESPCRDNSCNYLGLETVFDRLMRQKNWNQNVMKPRKKK